METFKQRLAIFIIAGILDSILSLLIFSSVFSFPIENIPLWFLSSGVEALVIYELMYQTRTWVRRQTLPIYVIVFAIIRLPVNGAVYSLWYRNTAIFQNWFQPSKYFEFFGQISSSYYILISSSLLVIIAYLLIFGKWRNLTSDPDIICRKCKHGMRVIRITTFTNAVGRRVSYTCPHCGHSYTYDDWYTLFFMFMVAVYWAGLFIRDARIYAFLIFIMADFKRWFEIIFMLLLFGVAIIIFREAIRRLLEINER